MELSQTDKEKIANWLQSKCGQMRCVCCGNSQWAILELATLPIVIDLHTTRFYYAQGVPQVSVVCQYCGQMLFFNPGIIGFQPDRPEAAQQSHPLEPAVGTASNGESSLPGQ